MEQPPEYGKALKTIQALGLQPERLVSARRGATTIKVSNTKKEEFALKFVDIENIPEDTVYNPVRLLQREASFLFEFKDFTNNIYIKNGVTAANPWLLTKWITGASAVVVTQSVLSSKQNMRKNLLNLFVNMLKKVSELHSMGFTHGDLQPAHFLIDDSATVSLIDFALTKTATDTSFSYKGGLVHFNSPEICKDILRGAENVFIDTLSEVYSIASVLFYLYTGKTSTFYGSYDYQNVPLAKSLDQIAHGKASTFVAVGAESFEELEHVLQWCLESDREKRCPDVATALREIINIYEKIL